MALKLPAFLANETVKKTLIEIATLSIAGIVCAVASTVIVKKLSAPHPISTESTPDKEEKSAEPSKESHASQKEEKPTAKGEEHKGAKEGAAEGSTGLHVALKPVIVNLADTTSRRYAKVTFTLDMKNSKVKEDLESLDPQVYDTLIKVLGNYHFDEISSSAGKEAMKEEVKNRLNLILKDGLANVYITELIIQ